MGSFYARQPNGKICRFTTVTDSPTDWDMSEEEFIQNYIDNAVEVAKYEAEQILKHRMRSFDWVLDGYSARYSEMKLESFNQFLHDVGYDGTYEPWCEDNGYSIIEESEENEID